GAGGGVARRGCSPSAGPGSSAAGASCACAVASAEPSWGVSDGAKLGAGGTDVVVVVTWVLRGERRLPGCGQGRGLRGAGFAPRRQPYRFDAGDCPTAVCATGELPVSERVRR